MLDFVWGCLCGPVVLRCLWVLEEYKLISCRVSGAQYPVVFVLFGFVRVQEGVSRHLILFAICRPAETQLLTTAGMHVM